MGYSMARFSLQVQPSTDIDTLSDLIDEIGNKLAEEEKWRDRILQPPAFVSIGDITGNSTEIIIAGKTQPSDQWSVTAEMRRRLHEAFDANGIKLAVSPLPTAAKQRR